MKTFSLPVLLFVFFAAGCAHGPDPAASLALPVAPPASQQLPAASAPAPIPLSLPETQVKDEAKSVADAGDIAVPGQVNAVAGNGDDYGDIEVSQGEKETRIEIADPLEPFNRAMYHFNDKLYFWVLKPVAQGYGKVVPEPARVSVGNFFKNLAFPIRFINCLLQANFAGAAAELGRFTINTLWGIGGLLDPASSKEIQLSKQDQDFGQTLGFYGLGQGFFITWPLFGPSNLRDTLGMVGDGFLTPTTYLSPWYAGAGTRAVDRVNDTSLSLGDYESLKGAAIDPYVAIRDAYVQYRWKKVNRKSGNSPAEEPGSPKNE
jgi:phospholipid-binding lipoprotein MlaA